MVLTSLLVVSSCAHVAVVQAVPSVFEFAESPSQQSALWEMIQIDVANVYYTRMFTTQECLLHKNVYYTRMFTTQGTEGVASEAAPMQFPHS